MTSVSPHATAPGVPWPAARAMAVRMAALARAFADRLDTQQRGVAMLPLLPAAHADWDYRPRQRPGLPLRAMREDQRAACWHLVDTALSAAGAAKVRGVLALEAMLQERTANKDYRDPLNYALVLFGEPGSGPWAWRFEGHHVSLTLTIVPGIGMAVTPHFFGANPFSSRVIPNGHGELQRVLEQESGLAFAVLHALQPDQLASTIIAAEPPPDFLTGPGREHSLRQAVGLPLAAMSHEARSGAERLIDAFFGHLAPELARPLAHRLREAGPGALRFAWAGATSPDRLHYWRLHGPTLLLEYDRTEPDHAHSVWHDPSDHFGEDQLRRHREAAHHHG